MADGLRTTAAGGGELNSAMNNLKHRAMLGAIHMRVAAAVQHIAGPRDIATDGKSTVVTALMRDAETHVEHFIEHHLAMGAAGIVLMDNGSADASIIKARRYADVIVLRCDLPFRTCKQWMRRYLFNRYGRRGWHMALDIDERFDFPSSRTLGLPGLVRYLNSHGFTGVIAHMLDMFPDGAIASWATAGASANDAVWYDISEIRKKPYPDLPGCTISNTKIRWHSHGVRSEVLNGVPALTKVPLLKRAGGARPSFMNVHNCYNARLADVTGVLLHYKFDATFVEQCRLAVDRGNYWDGSAEYRAYLEALEDDWELALRTSTSEQLESVEQLVSAGFLTTSDTYDKYRGAVDAGDRQVTHA